MEHVADKMVILAGTAACLSLHGTPTPAVVAAALFVACGTLIFDVAPGPCKPALVMMGGLLPLAIPDAAALLALPAYDGVTLLRAPGAEAMRFGGILRYAFIVPLTVLGVGLLSHRAPTASSAIVVCLCALAALLSHRTGSALIRRRRAQASHDEFTARAIVLGQKNRQLEREVQEARQRDEAARIDLPPEFAQLTPREVEVARLAAEGLDNREIAARAYMGEGTVRNIISSILTKLGLKNRTQIAVIYWKARAR